MMIAYDPARTALFLDVDGTLIDIAATPQGVIVPPDLPVLLDRLETAFGGALGIVTGRSIADVDHLLAPAKLVVAGVHGAEVRTERHGPVRDTTQPLPHALVRAVHRLAGSEPGVTVEVKGGALAVHYRLAPAAGPRLERALQGLLGDHGRHLVLCRGRKVLEVLPRTVSKGAALERLAGLPAFRGRRPLMIGDDVSDEAALETARRLGGSGLSVRGEHFPAESADFASPGDVRAWLATLVERTTA